MLDATDALTTGTGLLTVSETEAESFAGLSSGGVAALALAVLSISAPLARLHLTVARTVNVAASPFATLPLVHVIGPESPTAGVMQFQPSGAESETNSVPAGTLSFNVTLPAPRGPLFVRPMV